MTRPGQCPGRLLSGFIFEQYEKRYDSAIARFVLSGLQRQIASSLYVAALYYRGCYAAGELATDGAADLDIEETDFEPDENNTGSEYRLKDDPEFRNIIQSICIERLYEEDTKFKTLTEILRRSGRVIVFAFYKRSLRYLQERLDKEGIRSVRIDGDVPSCPEVPEEDERLHRIGIFRDDPQCKVMLSSQVGSEGLDFQFCDTLVNWDLPWNPMVVEQRIGRIDRLGQQSEKIFIHSLVSKGTIEELILARLYQRIGIFKDSIGDLEPILGPIITELRRDLFNPKLSMAEKEQKVIRSAQAIEKERQYLQQLEKEGAPLIGHDEVIRWHLITSNPFCECAKPKRIVKKWHHLKPDEYLRLQEAAPDLRWKAFYALAYGAGPRYGELFSLTWGNIDFERGAVRIENRAGTPTMPAFHVKDAEARTVPLPEHTVKILLEWQAQAPEGVPYILLTADRYEKIIKRWKKLGMVDDRWENRFMVNNVRRSMKVHCRRAGIDFDGKFTIHTFRKSYGQNQANAGVPIKTLQYLMGHSDEKTTLTYYTQLDKSQAAMWASATDRLLAEAQKKIDTGQTLDPVPVEDANHQGNRAGNINHAENVAYDH